MKLAIKKMLILSCLVSGCATVPIEQVAPTAEEVETQNRAVLQRWVGQDIYDLFSAWGPATSSHTSKYGNGTYTYFSYNPPQSSYKLVCISTEGATCHATVIRTGEPDMDYMCDITFRTSESGQIIAWSQIGNACVLK